MNEKGVMKQITQLLGLLVLLALLTTGCALVDEEPPASRYPAERERAATEQRFSQLPVLEDSVLEDSVSVRMQQPPARFPWDTFVLNRDLEGQPIRDLFILEGDQLYQAGKLPEALAKYEVAQTSRLTVQERDALVMRLGSLLLALDRPQDALRLLSDHFRETNRDEDGVGARFSILFAYAYGSLAQFDQSLAWFSRAFRLEAGRGLLAEVSENGVRSLLRATTDAQFQQVVLVWENDPFIASVLGKERFRRNKVDYAGAPAEFVSQFWMVSAPGVYGIAPSTSDQFTMAVLLPLSGKFARLGTSAQHGIELALLGQQASGLVASDFRDTAGDSLTATAALRSLAATHSGNLIVLGPLLSDVGAELAVIAQRSRVPMLTFSKRSFFQTGDGVYRLGPTIESQIESLVAATRDSLNLSRIAIVAPEGVVGQYQADVFRKTAVQSGLEVVYQVSVNPQDEARLVSAAVEVESYEPDAIFFPDDLVPAGRFYSSLSPNFRRRVRLLGLANWDDPVELKRSRTVLEGIVFVSPFFRNSEREVVQKFNETYQKSYGMEPDFLAAQGFDAATIILAALRQSLLGNDSFEQVMGEIEEYDGLTGKIQVTPTGELKRAFAVVELHQQQLRELSFPVPGEYSTAQREFILRGNERIPTSQAPEVTEENREFLTSENPSVLY